MVSFCSIPVRRHTGETDHEHCPKNNIYQSSQRKCGTENVNCAEHLCYVLGYFQIDVLFARTCTACKMQLTFFPSNKLILLISQMADKLRIDFNSTSLVDLFVTPS